MISSAITVLRPSAPGVSPGTSLPAGPAGTNGTNGTNGDPGSQGSQGIQGPQGAPTTVNGHTGASITLSASDVGALPNTVTDLLTLMTTTIQSLPTAPSASGPIWWSNGGQPTYS